MKLKRINLACINSTTITDAAFIIFLCAPFIKRTFAFILATVGLNEYASLCTSILICLPVVIIFAISPKKIKPDSIALVVGLIAFFLITYAIHPEYEFWYRRPYYGVWDYVLRPDNGLYAYFFFRLIDDSKKIFKLLRLCGLIMLVYYAFLLLSALRRGYWESTDHDGNAIQLSYDLTFGYDVSLYALVFLYAGLKDRKLMNWALAIAYIVMIILGGSRGPLLCLAIFVLIMGMQMLSSWRRHPVVAFSIVALILTFIIFYKEIFTGIASLLEHLGFSSRTLTMLLNGEITDDNGREKIWNAATKMIHDNPFGYGAMGARHVIYYYHDVGHPHQFFLEVLVDFGVLTGGFLILMMLGCSMKIIFKPEAKEWNGLFIIFFCRSFQLILSGTFWHVMPFWACVGIAVCYYNAVKRTKIKRNKIDII